MVIFVKIKQLHKRHEKNYTLFVPNDGDFRTKSTDYNYK